jgi:hypothetical protein
MLTVGAGSAAAQDDSMSFFVTSRGPGDGANLGGLQGADAHCQSLAEAAGAGDRTWHAYLSITHPAAPIHARDRIGRGPWYNADGTMIAADVDELHSDSNNITKSTALDENGNTINGAGDDPNRHDMLTGSTADGRAWDYYLIDVLNFDRGEGTFLTCSNWTYSGDQGSAMTGHHDRSGSTGYSSWNAAHPSIGCGQQDLVGTGGDGLFYCFAID